MSHVPVEVLVDDHDVGVLRRHRGEQIHVALLRPVDVHRGRTQGPRSGDSASKEGVGGNEND